MRALIFILTLITLTSISYAQTISSIQITGLNTISKGTILSHIPIEVGDTVYQDTSNHIIRSLHKTSLFEDVFVLNDNGIIKIHLKEKPNIYNIEITGYSDAVIQKEQLDRLLKSVRLTQGEIFNQQVLNRVIKELKRNYQESGYYLATVQSKVDIDNKNRISVVITIKENNVVLIRSMQILNTKIFSQEDLLDEFAIGTPDFFLLNYFTEKDQYSKHKLESGLKKITALYKNAGYIDFKISQVITDITTDKKHIDIKITLYEGQVYKVGKIKFSGDSLYYSDKDIKNKITFKSGEIFNQKALTISAQNIVNYYTKKGYAFIDVSPITKQNPIAKTIDVEIPIHLSKRVYINRIIIKGNALTQDEVIRRELVQSEGSLYSSEDVRKSITNLKRLGYFSDVNMQVEKIPNAPDKINLILNVSETKTGNFTVGLSHSNETGLSTNLGVSEKNFLGTGNTLIVDFIQNKSLKKYGFSFIDPHFNDAGHSINYGLSHHELDASNLDISNYQISTSGGHIGYGIPVGEYIRTAATFHISNHDITCGSGFIDIENTITTHATGTLLPNHRSDAVVTTDATGTTTINTPGAVSIQCAQNKEQRISLSWKKNTLNNYRNPTKGENISLSADIALPTGDFKYIKLDLKHDHYTQINKNLVFKLDYKIGIAKGYGGEELPFFRRYFGGGEHSVRGFAFNTLGDKYSTGRAKGGEVSLVGRAALVAPVPFVKDSSAMRLTTFIDAGSIYDTISDVNISDIRASVGVGFSWITVLGPITISYAIPVNKKDTDSVDKFNFSLGSYF